MKDITYHSLLSEEADLLDSLGGSLLEGSAMNLTERKREKRKLVFRPKCPVFDLS